jgi:hypothetical protein
MPQISSITTDGSGRLLSFNEDQYAVTIRRDATGKPLVARAVGPGKTLMSEFKYAGSGALTGIIGNFESSMLATLLAEASGSAAPAVVWGA